MNDNRREEALSPQTLALYADADMHEGVAMAPPIYQTSTFRAASAEDFLDEATGTHPRAFYTRYGNPTHAQTEAVIAALEGAEAALLFSSGMGALSVTLLGLLSAGDHLITQTSHYGGTTSLAFDT